MRFSLRSTLAAAFLPAAILTTACGSSPVEPTAPATATAQPKDLTGYVVVWSKKAQPEAAQPQAAKPQNLTGYVVVWSKKQPQSQP